MSGGGVCWLAVVVLLWSGAARGEEPSPTVAREGQAPLLAPDRDPDTLNGVRFVWPDLEAPEYAPEEAAPIRRALARWHDGVPRGPRPTVRPGSSAALYLDADLAFVEASAGAGAWLAAAERYEKALRTDADFADAARAWFMLGQTDLVLGFGPEATAAFQHIAREHPTSPLAAEGRLGEAMALRLRHRPDEARKIVDAVLAGASGPLLCRARQESVAAARASGTPADIADAAARFATSCPEALTRPRVLAEYAEALAAAGEVDRARTLLAAPRATRGPDEARLQLLAGSLARQAGDADGARAAYERVLGLAASENAVAEARMRLSQLDGAARPERAVAGLLALADDARSAAVRAAALGTAAETAATAGRYDEALGLLERAATLGPDGVAQAEGRRGEILGRWIAALQAADDPAGVVTVYAAHQTAIQALAAPEDALAVARALARFGLHATAARLLALVAARAGAPPALEVARAEEALAAGDVTGARATALHVVARAPELAQRARGVAARAALAGGDAPAAAELASAGVEPDVRAEVARALVAGGEVTAARATVAPALADAAAPVTLFLAAGDAAAAGDAWDAAADAYAHALAAGTGSARAEAAAGLARAALAQGDPTPGVRLLADSALGRRSRGSR